MLILKSQLLVLAVVLVAGCGSPALDQSGTPIPSMTAEPSSTTTTRTLPIIPLQPPQAPSNVTWTNCKLIAVGYSYVGNTNPAPPPSGWPPATAGIGSAVYVETIWCERVRWGDFERPVTMVLESHSNLDPPEECRKGDYMDFVGLHSFWIDDGELASYVRDTYGMPVHHGRIEVTDESDAATTRLTFTWNETGSEPSMMTGLQVNQDESTISRVTRFFWDWGNGTAMMDWHQVRTFSNLQAPVQAEMNPPMLLSELNLPIEPVLGEIMPNVELSGDLTMFGDRECKQPRS